MYGKVNEEKEHTNEDKKEHTMGNSPNWKAES